MKKFIIQNNVNTSNITNITKSDSESNDLKTLKNFYKHIYDTKPAWYIENGRVELAVIEEAYRTYFNDELTTKLVISRQLNGKIFIPIPNTVRCTKKILVSYANLKKLF